MIIVFGLYSVVWGKSKEMSVTNKPTFDQEKAHELPVVDKRTSNLVDTYMFDETTLKSKKPEKNSLQLVEP